MTRLSSRLANPAIRANSSATALSKLFTGEIGWSRRAATSSRLEIDLSVVEMSGAWRRRSPPFLEQRLTVCRRLLNEIVLVDLPHFVDLLDPDADPVADHQCGELLSVYQHHALGDAGDEVISRAWKIRGRDQHALGRPMPLKPADEIAYFAERNAIVRIEPLGLDIDHVEAELHPP
jgi:hypothetical protein